MSEKVVGALSEDLILRPDHPDPGALMRQLIAFFAIAFAITWGLAVVFFTMPALVRWLGNAPGLPAATGSWLAYPAVYAPTISAVICLGAMQGPCGYRGVFAPLLRPRRPMLWAGWLLIAFAVLPTGWLIVGTVADVAGEEWLGSADAHALFVGVPVVLLTTTHLLTDIGPLGEELGWRGYAMPRLLALYRPLPSGLIVGAIWSIWHLPIFFVSGSGQSQLSYPQFFVGLTGTSVVCTWLYLRTQGNWLLAGIVPHAVMNSAADLSGYTVKSPMFPLAAVLLSLVVMIDPVMRGRAATT